MLFASLSCDPREAERPPGLTGNMRLDAYPAKFEANCTLFHPEICYFLFARTRIPPEESSAAPFVCLQSRKESRKSRNGRMLFCQRLRLLSPVCSSADSRSRCLFFNAPAPQNTPSLVLCSALLRSDLQPRLLRRRSHMLGPSRKLLSRA